MTFFIVPDGKKFLQDAKKQLAEDGVPDVCALTIWKQDPPPPQTNKQKTEAHPSNQDSRFLAVFSPMYIFY